MMVGIDLDKAWPTPCRARNDERASQMVEATSVSARASQPVAGTESLSKNESQQLALDIQALRAEQTRYHNMVVACALVVFAMGVVYVDGLQRQVRELTVEVHRRG